MSSGAAIYTPVGARDDADLGRATMRRVSGRLLPFLFVLFVFNFIDRTNVAIAALQMNRDLRLSATAYGLGAGIFFLGYALFEVPSNLILVRVGARRWIARIMVSWGLVATAMMFVRTPLHFYLLRFLLGVAEAGFVPGIIYYLGQWFPAAQRGRAIARFMLAIPVAAAVGNALGGWLLGLDGRLGLAGWQWLFLVEGAPSVLLGFSVLALLTDRLEEAPWLSDEQRSWLAAQLRREQEESAAPHGLAPLRALAHPMVWLVSLVLFLVGTTAFGFAFWAPIVIRDTLHASNATTGLIAGGTACLSAIAMLLVGASSDRTGERYLHAGSCAVVAALGYVGAALVPHPVVRVACFALVSIGTISFLAPFWCIPAVLLRGSAAAAGIALVSSVGSLGGFVGPYAVGLLQDLTGGMAGAFLGFAALALITAALCLVLRRYAAFASRGRGSASGQPIEPGAAVAGKVSIALCMTSLLSPIAMSASAQTGRITGSVTDTLGAPLGGAQVIAPAAGLSGETSVDGIFTISHAPAGRYDLTVYRIGFKALTVNGVDVRPGEAARVTIRLEPTAVQLAGVVVAASRRLEKITDAPATITAVDAGEIATTIGNSYTPALKGARGLAFNQVGVTSVYVNARGFDVPLNTRMLMIEDGRLAVLAENGLPVGPLTTIPKVDLAGVEVLVGPGSALYGPNASNGVIVLRTKDPRQSPGWTVDVAGGSRNFYDVQARYAGVAKHWGYKVAGEYETADDWTDEVYYPAIAPGGSPIREIGTDYHTTGMRASGSVSRYFDNGARLQLTSGVSERDGLGRTALGRTQVTNYQHQNYQLQYSGARWFAQAYMTHSNTGRTFNLNSFSQNSVRYASAPEDSVRDLSRVPADGRLQAAELQNNFSVGMAVHTGIAAVDNTHVIWGGQFRRDRVSSYGHQLSDRRTGRPIHIDERGIYAQLESPLSSAIRLVVAGRYDKNSRYPAEFSPKASLLLTSGDQTLRLTYNKAYRAPGILWTESYYPDVQPNVGVFGNVDGFDIRDGTGAVVKTYAPLKSETSDTWEAGYKGVLRDRLYADVTVYYSTYRDFLTNAAVIANPFAPSPTTAYNHRTGEMVTDENGRQLVTLSFFNVGEATSSGIDAGLRYYLTDRISASSSVTLARLNSIETKPGDPPDASGFNTSPARITSTVELTDVPKRTSQAMTVRYVNGYDFRAGVHYGHIPSFATLDFTASHRPERSRATVVLQAQNLFTCVSGTVTPPAAGISPTAMATYTAGRKCGFGERHRELLNMPAIGAMFFLGVRWEGGRP